MKMLQVLVGYLALTSLPFNPLVFASPLAFINFDGYVNKTHIDGALIKQVLDNIVETCPGQTVTTQKRRDSAVREIVSGDIIESRQEGIPPPPPPLIIATLLVAVIIGIAWILDDNYRREAFTQNAIANAMTKYPNFNWVICHSPYSVGFDGVQGTDWGYNHYELGISLYRTIGYDIYWARSGTFYRYGDGGFINWAYNGNILGTDDGGATVHFGVIET